VPRLTKDERARLDSLDYLQAAMELGDYQRIVHYQLGRECTARCAPRQQPDGSLQEVHDHWRQGDGRPGLADDDPAVMCAIGRCASSRVAGAMGARLEYAGWHPGQCGWCGYPLEALLRALDWAAFTAQLVLSEVWHWDAINYSRSIRSMVYENPQWAIFDRLTPKEREDRVAEVIRASQRDMLGEA